MNIDPLVFVIFVGALADWVVTAILWRAARRKPRIGALSERTTMSFIIAVCVSAFGFLAFANSTSSIDPDVARTVGRAVAITISVYPLGWLVWYRRLRKSAQGSKDVES